MVILIVCRSRGPYFRRPLFKPIRIPKGFRLGSMSGMDIDPVVPLSLPDNFVDRAAGLPIRLLSPMCLG